MKKDESIIELEDSETEEEDDQPGLRRSTRQSNKPKYLEDYVLLAEEEREKLLLS